MTREEAAKILKEHRERKFKHTFYTLNEYQAATDMAIQALEQQPCDDCISRQAAIDAMSNALERVFPEHRAIAERTMNKLPSVSTEKTGRWEEYGTRQVQILPTYRCSVCGEEYLQSEHFKYCPNCGAKNATTAIQGRK